MVAAAAQTFRTQHHISELLRSRSVVFDFPPLFAVRLGPVVARGGLNHVPRVLGDLLRGTLLSAAALLSPGLLIATHRLGTNSGATSHGFGNTADD